MNSETVLLFAAGLAFLSPIVVQSLANRQRRAERKEDAARQDRIAGEVTTVRNDLAVSTKDTSGKLEVIHALVNSAMTAAMQAELNAVIRELASLREILDMKQAAGREPTTHALTAVKMAEQRVAELTEVLRARHEAVSLTPLP